jgi:hypothetical protein
MGGKLILWNKLVFFKFFVFTYTARLRRFPSGKQMSCMHNYTANNALKQSVS